MNKKRVIVIAINLILMVLGKGEVYAQADTTVFHELLLKAQKESFNNPNQSLAYVHQALSLAKKINDDRYLGSAYNGLGIMYEIFGNADSSVYYYEKAVEAIARTDSKYLQNSIKLNLSQQYFESGKILEAIEMASSAKQVLDSLNIKPAMMVARAKLAYLSMQVKDYSQAIRYRKEELEIAEELKDTISILNIYTGLATIHAMAGSSESSRFYLNKVHDLLQEHESLLNLMQYKKIRASIAISDSQYKQAISILLEAKELNQQVNNESYGISIDNYLAEAYICQGNIDSAGYYCEIIKSVLPKLLGFEAKHLKVEVLNNLVKYYALISNYKQAYTHLIQYNEEYRQLASLEDKIKITNYIFERELLESEQENELLRLQNESDKETILVFQIGGVILLVLTIGLIILTIRANNRKREKQKAIEELRKIDTIKDGLLEIISHDLRSPLSSLAGLVNLSNQNLLKQEDAKPLFTMLETTMDKSLSLADNLLIWSKLQLNELKLNRDVLNLQQNITNIAKIYNSIATSKGIHTELKMGHTSTVLADSFMLSLMLRNIVGLSVINTNTGGSVTIETKEENNKVKVIITNIGTYLEYVKVCSWKARTPFGNNIRDKKRTAGLGLYVANEYLLKIGSALTIDKLEDGISYSFNLPTN